MANVITHGSLNTPGYSVKIQRLDRRYRAPLWFFGVQPEDEPGDLLSACYRDLRFNESHRQQTPNDLHLWISEERNGRSTGPRYLLQTGPNISFVNQGVLVGSRRHFICIFADMPQRPHYTRAVTRGSEERRD